VVGGRWNWIGMRGNGGSAPVLAKRVKDFAP
jgi:hypothetical protein